MQNIIIKTIVCGMIENNTFVIRGEGSKSAIVIDPSGDSKEVMEYLDENGLTCELIALTHAHFDHIQGVKPLYERYNCDIALHGDDLFIMKDANESGFYMFMRRKVPYEVIMPNIILKDGDSIERCGLSIKVIQTGGHTPGGVCFLCQEHMFAGDTLFYRSIGRSDFDYSNHQDLLDSLGRLYKLEGDYTVYPGHGQLTTLEDERRKNMFMAQWRENR